MKPLFHPKLVNGPLGDPLLFVDLFQERRALMFDLGSAEVLRPGAILRVSDAFVSHTHIDHFVGFDHVLRIHLARDTTMRVYGPPGITENVTGKLSGYTWNLVEGYPFVLEVCEVGSDSIRRTRYSAGEEFKPRPLGKEPFDGGLVDEDLFTVRAVHLDHQIDSMAYALTERFHINIDKEALRHEHLEVGPWIGAFKRAIRSEMPPDTPIRAQAIREGEIAKKSVPLGELVEKVVKITRGQRIAYVSDAVYSDANREKIVSLARGADLLYCEASFLDADRALERYHLTAAQAGTLAKDAGVGKLVIFHISPKHCDEVETLERQALEAMKGKGGT